MAVNFVEIQDIDGNWQSINLKQIARIAWGERPDYTKVDMVYLVDDSEVALEHLSESSKRLAEAIGIESLEELLDGHDGEEDEGEDEIMFVGTETDMPFSYDDDEDEDDEDEVEK